MSAVGREAVDKRGARTKCCQVPSWEGVLPTEAARKGFTENVAFQLDLEREVIVDIWTKTREKGIKGKSNIINKSTIVGMQDIYSRNTSDSI